ncbi:MAG: hypothetical protein ACI4QI_06250 [Candidatus Coproplasma sp.]
MVTFDNEEIKKYIARVKLFKSISTAAFVIAFCAGIFSAVAVGSMKEQAGLITATWIIAAVFAAALVVFFTLLKLTEKRLKECVCDVLKTTMEENSDLYSGDSEIALVVEYEGDKVTLLRQNSFKKIVFDISGIKKSVKTYSFFGVWILQYLEAYFSLHGEGYSDVTIVDKFDKRNDKYDEYQIIENGEVDVYRPEKNYFLKRGLIK